MQLLTVAALGAVALGSPSDPPCQCEPTWTNTIGSCVSNAKTMTGCPSLEALRQCDPTADRRWCKTTTPRCRDQYGWRINSGTMSFCDVTDPAQREVVKSIEENEQCKTWRMNNGTTELYDISILKKVGSNPTDGTVPNFRTSNYFSFKKNKVNSDDQDYYLNVCAGLVDFAGNSDTNPDAAGPVSAYEENPSNTSYGTHVLARFGRSTNLTVVKDNDLRLSMGDGDMSDNHDPNCPMRKVDIIFVCSQAGCGNSPENGGLGAPVFIDEFKKCEYVFVWNSCAACPLGHPARQGCGPNSRRSDAGASSPGAISTMSPSGVLLITVAVLFSVYLVGGFAYNRIVHNERGLSQIPHYEFWSGCFSNIAAAPGAVSGMFIGKPKPSSISQNFHPGLLDDDDEEDELEDADDKSYFN